MKNPPKFYDSICREMRRYFFAPPEYVTPVIRLLGEEGWPDLFHFIAKSPLHALTDIVSISDAETFFRGRISGGSNRGTIVSAFVFADDDPVESLINTLIIAKLMTREQAIAQRANVVKALYGAHFNCPEICAALVYWFIVETAFAYEDAFMRCVFPKGPRR